MSEIPDSVVERLTRFAGMVAELSGNPCLVEEAREVRAMLPKPVDPDLVKARELAKPWLIYDDVAVLPTDNDNLRAILEGIKYGRMAAKIEGKI